MPSLIISRGRDVSEQQPAAGQGGLKTDQLRWSAGGIETAMSLAHMSSNVCSGVSARSTISTRSRLVRGRARTRSR